MGTGPVRFGDIPAVTGSRPVTSADPALSKTSYLPPAAIVDPLLGQTLAGRYVIIRKLGEGGMGAVYLATHTLLEKQVALKVLHSEFSRKPDLVERFMQEAKSASRIRHENVIDISDFGATPEGLVFFAMELLTGHDLHEEVARARLAGQLLPWARTKKIFLQVCAALHAAHGKGIVHRDLKPENIYLVHFLGDPDFVKLLDFGIAKLTEVNEGGRKLTKTGMLFGTPEYMSPEQARGEHVDHRVDVYAMGCILFQLVTGKVPFEAENFMGVLSLHLTEPPPAIPAEVFDRIGAPREIASVIEKALAKDRNVRWQSIEELATAVGTICGDPLPSGSVGHIPRQRAPSVQAPPHTTQRAVAVAASATSKPTPAPAPGARVRTQWTGSLNVPHHDDGEARPAPAKRSRVPLLTGLAVVLAGGAVAAVIVMKGGGPAPGPQTGSSGSAIGPGSQIAAVTPDAAPALPALPPLPEQVVIKLDSRPRGADIKDVASDRVLGKTPLTFKLRGSHDARQFALQLEGYGDAVVELVPNRERIEYTEKLEKGATGTAVVRKVPDQSGGSATVARPVEAGPAAGSAVVKPETGSAGSAAIKVPDLKPLEPLNDDCGDPPCLKTIVPGLQGSGSGR